MNFYAPLRESHEMKCIVLPQFYKLRFMRVCVQVQPNSAGSAHTRLRNVYVRLAVFLLYPREHLLGKF